MIVYYPGPDARITDEVFEVAKPIYQRFFIGELKQVHIARVETRAGFRRPFVIRALYRGEWVSLFQTTDRLTLRKVARALLRALERVEARRDVRQYYQPAA
jgi:hypothetical protein